jgi:hypothetical protein
MHGRSAGVASSAIEMLQAICPKCRKRIGVSVIVPHTSFQDLDEYVYRYQNCSTERRHLAKRP